MKSIFLFASNLIHFTSLSVLRQAIDNYMKLANNKMSLSTINTNGEIYLQSYESLLEKNETTLLLEKHLKAIDKKGYTEISANDEHAHMCNCVILDPNDESNVIYFYTRIFVFGKYCEE